jgi:fructose-1,6-bisphosphatase/inositol monophosphatase family enzyme
MSSTIRCASETVAPDERDARVALMLELADSAGELALRYFQSDALTVSIKSDQSPVTQADTAIETLLRQRIHAHFPDDAILGEEHGESSGADTSTSNWRWILDPIDGTVSFAAGVPLFGTLIALERNHLIEAGICAMPALRERVWAARGQGAWWERIDVHGVAQRSAARVRNGATLANALLCTTGLEYFERSNTVANLVRVAERAGRVDRSRDASVGFWAVSRDIRGSQRRVHRLERPLRHSRRQRGCRRRGAASRTLATPAREFMNSAQPLTSIHPTTHQTRTRSSSIDRCSND